MIKKPSLIILLLLAAIIGCHPDRPAAPLAKAIAINSSQTYGSFFADDLGRTLYFFANDYGTNSNCTGDCASNWPIFYVANLTAPLGSDQKDFGEITRNDGRMQTTYKGWPLYYYSGDKRGEINADRLTNRWFVAKPDYQIMVAANPAAENKLYLVDASGMTLYVNSNDAATIESSCQTSACVQSWPSYYDHQIANPNVPSILNGTDFGQIARVHADPITSFITTYKNKPLYYHISDEVRGDVSGQGAGNGIWTKLYEPF